MSNPLSSTTVVPFDRNKYCDSQSPPALTICEAQLKKFELTPEQKEAFLEALWTLLSGFIDLGYGLHPTQHLRTPSDLCPLALPTAEG